MATHRKIRPFIMASAALALFIVLALVGVGYGAGLSTTQAAAPVNPAVNLEQCRNGDLTADPANQAGKVVQCKGAAYQNGNLGPENSHFREGESISYRSTVTGLTSGQMVTLRIGYDVIHSGKNALDYLTNDNRWQTPETSVAATPDCPFGPVACSTVPTARTDKITILSPITNRHIDRTLDFTTSTGGPCETDTDSHPAHSQPLASFTALPDAERVIELFGATKFSATDALNFVYLTPAPNLKDVSGGDQEQQVDLTFTAGGSTVVLAWGGHIASRKDWGCANGPQSAGGISGSPYHMRIKQILIAGENNDQPFSIGNQDRSLKASAVIPDTPTDTVTAIHAGETDTGTPVVVTSVEVGSKVHDSATVTPDPGVGVGTVNFSFFTNGTCVGTPLTGNTSGELAIGVGGIVDNALAKTMDTTAGAVSYRATYTPGAGLVGSISPCEPLAVVDAKIELSPLTAFNKVGEVHTIRATVKQDDGLPATLGDLVAGFGPVPDGTTVTFSLSNNLPDPPGTNFSFVVKAGDDDKCTTTTTAGVSSCTVQINSTSAGSVDIHATTTFIVNGVSLTRATDSTHGSTADAHKVAVDAFVTIGSDDTNSIGEPHTFTVHAEMDLGSGFVNASGTGTTVTVTLTDGTGVTHTVTSSTCNITDTITVTSTTFASGSCSTVFNSNTAGTVTGHALVEVPNSLTGLTVCCLRAATDGTSATPTPPDNSRDAVKTYVDGSLAWSKNDNDGHLLVGATFEVCRTKDRGGSTVTGECVPVKDNSTADADSADGKFLRNLLPLGHYTVRETIAPPGFVGDFVTTKSADLTIETSNQDAVISEAFVNNRPIVKIGEFGYTNTPTGTPKAGVVSGTTVYTVKLHNYGLADATLVDGTKSTLVISTDKTAGTLVCTPAGSSIPTNSIIITGTLAADDGAVGGLDDKTVATSCVYDGLNDGSTITATLNISYEVNDPTHVATRVASGSPATIVLTIQGD